MKTKMLKVLFGLVNFAAVFAAMTPSRLGHYEPECPKNYRNIKKIVWLC
ncbi:cyclic lactone autoinducer peptide [Coprobacillaceae bacterium CR2/5/TPMF4]|nr:cyclic lactone autoinducer peptide [Coprobacillaceae bacterium CR2/5/TPMF4]